MLVKVTPPTMDDLLAASAWFPLLDSGAQARVRDELREVDVPQGGALCRLGDTPLHWYGAIEGLLKWTVTSGDGRSVTLGGLSAGSGLAKARCCAAARARPTSLRCGPAVLR